MQKKVQSKTLENIFRCVQCHASCCVDWLKNILHAWWAESRSEKFATNHQYTKTDRNSGWRTCLRSPVVGSIKNCNRMVNEYRTRHQQNIRSRRHREIFIVTKSRSYLSSPSDSIGRVLVLSRSAVGHHLQRSKLLRIVQQLWRNDECGWRTYLFFPDNTRK